MKWSNADVRSLAYYLAELNGGHVVLVPSDPITRPLWRLAQRLLRLLP